MNFKPLRWGVGVALSASALFVACDGSNLFDADQNPFIEPRVTVSLPSEAFAGDSIGVSVSATAAQDLASLSVFIRGAVNKDTTIAASGRSLSAVVKFGLPQILTDTLVFVTAVATDKAGNVSKVRGDTMTVVGPPAIISVSQPDSLRVGTTSTFTIRAFGTRRITQLDLTIRGAISKDTTIFISPPRNDVTQSVSITLPAQVNDTSVRVGIVAKDVNGLSSVPVGVTLPLAVTAPVAVLQSPVPATVAPGSNLDVTVRATSMRGVTKIGVLLTGAVSKDTTIDILPPQTDVTRTVSIRIPGDASGNTVNVSAYAIDRSGARSVASAQVPVAINNGLPTVTSITTFPADSVRAGAVLDVRVTATGVRPITELNIRFRGATNADQRVVISPAATSVTKDVQIQIPVEVSDTTLTITAVATDQAGQLSPINAASTKTVRVTDVSAPTVTASPNKSNTAAGGTVQIRIVARDNVALSQVGFAVVNPAGDTIGTTPTLVATRGAVKDTTFSFTVPLTLTPRTVRVLGIAVDASGRRGISPAATLIIADSAAPAITVIAPSASGTLPLNDSVRVQIRVVDPTGIKEIRLRGESIRVDSLGPTRTVQRFIEKVITFPIAPGVPMPKDTTITRYLNAVPDSISESVNIIVTATDSLSNTASATTTILVGGPRVELRNPINNAQVVPGGTLLLTAFAVDRSSGIDSVRIVVSGVQSQTFLFKSPCAAATCAPNGLASNDSVVINQNYVVGPQLGLMQIQAIAWNRNRIAGTSSLVNVTVGNTAITDTAKPQVRVSMTANDRVELSDTITLSVAAQDIGQAGLRRIGVVIIANPGGTGVAPDTLYLDSVYLGTGRTGLQPAPFKFTLAQFGFTEINLLRLPRTMTFTVHAFAVDADGNCGANVSNTLLALQCDSIMPPLVPAGQKWFIAKNTPGLSQLVTVVPGFSRALPNAGSTIADLLVDTQRQRMYLSNQNFNRVELLNLKDSTFANPISVGSEPWGMFLNNAAVGIGAGTQRLMVANSGGTNISMVDVTQPCGGTGNSCTAVPGAAISEVGAERILTPNEVLFDVITAVNNGFVRYLTFVHDFSDRPQFIAQDQTGTILHSTKPTGSAPDGTVRYLVATPPGSARPFESKILFNQNAISQNNDATAVAYIDSIIVVRNTTTDDQIILCDHTPGNPVTGRYCSPALPLAVAGRGPLGAPNDAIDFIQDMGSDVFTAGGAWNIPNVGLSDTTFVTTSLDRQIVGFGEGGTGPFSRVWLWQSASQGISDDIAVQDLIGNAAERVLGIALNNNGSIGGARGANSAYFFSNGVNSSGDLRLQGVFSNGISGGNGGIALHPNHNLATGCNQNTLSFIATVSRSIKIVDTFNFRERGEILIRDNIVGPLRVALPLAAENAGIVGTPDEIAVKLYGVTGAGKAVIINVRTRDITGVIGGVCQ